MLCKYVGADNIHQQSPKNKPTTKTYKSCIVKISFLQCVYVCVCVHKYTKYTKVEVQRRSNVGGKLSGFNE